MPYVRKIRRTDLEITRLAENPGDLNYLITLDCLDYIERHGMNYENVNDVVGALECAKLELYRRLVAPYEDSKITENGDLSYYEQMGGTSDN